MAKPGLTGVSDQALALIELYNAPEGRYKQDVYLLPKKMGKVSVRVSQTGNFCLVFKKPPDGK